MTSRRVWWRVGLAAVLAMPAAAAPFAVAATGPNGSAPGANDAACRRTDNVVARTDGWTSIRPPASLAGLEGATADPARFGRIYAYNAATLARTDDGGCSWRTVFNPPATTTAAPRNLAHSQISHVVIGGGVWVTTSTATHNVGAAAVWYSKTGDGSYQYAGTGLPLGASITQLAPTNRAGTAYAIVQTFTGSALYVASSSSVGGAITWQRAAAPNLGTLIAVSVDPAVPNIVNIASGAAYARSGDGGVHFAPRHILSERIAAIDAWSNRLDIYLANGHMLTDQGGHTTSIPAPANVLSATHVPLEPVVRAVSTPTGDYGYDPTKQRWLHISPLGLVAQHLQMVSPTLPAVLVGTAAGFIYELPLRFPAAFVLSPPVAVPPAQDIALHGVGGFGKHPPTFAPGPRTITLHAGAQQLAHYALRVPARSGPLDVDFLVDTTNSMLPAISGLRRGMQQIIQALSHTTPDLEVGLADFRDYNDGNVKLSDVIQGQQLSPGGKCPQVVGSVLHQHHLYIRDQKIAPIGPSLGHALAQLFACGGGDIAEADTIAVMQALTGSGVPNWVPPGQEAGFRPDATKVIVLVTDSPMHLRAPYPNLTTTTDALRAYGVHLVGIDINDGLGGAVDDLRALAAGSNTDAPAGGVACKGKDQADVPAGAPMVCSVPVTGAGIAVLADPVAHLIEQVVDPGLLSVHLHSRNKGFASFVGSSREHANLHAKSVLPVTVDFRCPVSASDSRTPITLSGAVGPTTVAHTSVTLHCLPTTPAAIVPPAALVVAAAAAPPPPPPPLTSNINPNVNPGAGAATNEEQQNQVALADLSNRADSEPAVNENGPDLGAPMLYAAALLMTGAAALALRLRAQPQHSLAHVRRKGPS